MGLRARVPCPSDRASLAFSVTVPLGAASAEPTPEAASRPGAQADCWAPGTDHCLSPPRLGQPSGDSVSVVTVGCLSLGRSLSPRGEWLRCRAAPQGCCHRSLPAGCLHPQVPLRDAAPHNGKMLDPEGVCRAEGAAMAPASPRTPTAAASVTGLAPTAGSRGTWRPLSGSASGGQNSPFGEPWGRCPSVLNCVILGGRAVLGVGDIQPLPPPPASGMGRPSPVSPAVSPGRGCQGSLEGSSSPPTPLRNT